MENLDYYIRITEQIQGLERAIQNLDKFNSSVDGANSKASSFGNSAMSSFANVAFGINQMYQAGQTLFNLFSKPVQVAMDAEQAQVAFEVMLGSADKANVMIKQLKEDAAKTPFEFTDLQQGAKTLLNFGVEANKVRGYMNMLGDVAAGDANKFKSLSLVFGQVAAAGKLQGQDMLQMINVGFNPLQEISRTTGKSMATLKKEMEQGKISFDMVTKAFESATGQGGRFNGMMDKMSQTTAGRLSTMQDNITENILKPFGEMLIPAVNMAVDAIAGLITKAKPYLDAVFNVFAEIGNAVQKHIFPVFMELWEALKPLFTTLFEGFASAGEKGGLFTMVIQGIARAMTAIMPIIRFLAFVLEGIFKIVTWIIGGLIDLGNELGVFDTMASIVEGVYGVFDIVTDGIKSFISAIGEALDWLDVFADKVDEAKSLQNIANNAVLGALPQVQQAKTALEMQEKGALGESATNNKTAQTQAKTVTEGVSGGGAKPTTINITIGKVVEKIENNFDSTTDTTEANNFEDKMTNIFLRVINSSNQVYG